MQNPLKSTGDQCYRWLILYWLNWICVKSKCRYENKYWTTTYNIAEDQRCIFTPLVGGTEHHVNNSQSLAGKIRTLKLDSDEIVVSYDVTSLFTCIPTSDAVAKVRRRLIQDNTLSDRTQLFSDHICTLLSLCLSTTLELRKSFYWHKHSFVVGSLGCPEQVETSGTELFLWNGHWFKYVNDTWVKVKIKSRSGIVYCPHQHSGS